MAGINKRGDLQIDYLHSHRGRNKSRIKGKDRKFQCINVSVHLCSRITQLLHPGRTCMVPDARRCVGWCEW